MNKSTTRNKPLGKLALLGALLAAALIVVQPAYAHHEASHADESTADLGQQINIRQQAITAHEESHGIYALELYEPLRQLGQLQLAADRPDAAIESFRRMQHLMHRNHGVHTEKQIESIDYLIRGYGESGDFLALDRQQHFRFDIAARFYKDPATELIAARLQMADWYRNSGRFTQAMDYYDQATQGEPLPIDVQVRVLRSQALTLYLSGRCCASDRLHEALELIANSNGHHLDTSALLADYIDMTALENQQPETLRAHEQARIVGFRNNRDVLRLMSGSNDIDPRTDLYFDFGERETNAPAIPTVGYPVAMCGSTFEQLVTRDREISVDVKLTVSKSGRPGAIQIEGDAPNRLKNYLRQSLRVAKYQAATDEHGSLINAELSFRQTFAELATGISSRANVSQWNHLMVARTCQATGLQKI